MKWLAGTPEDCGSMKRYSKLIAGKISNGDNSALPHSPSRNTNAQSKTFAIKNQKSIAREDFPLKLTLDAVIAWFRSGSHPAIGAPILKKKFAAKFVAFLSVQIFYAPAMPSFDIVSKVNSMEIENAVNQAKKELASRFDFKGSKTEIVLDKNEIKLSAEDDFKVRTLNEMVIGKLAKRGVSLKSVEQCDPDVSPLGHARQVIKIKQGIESSVAKQITGFIRDGKFKVTTQIQGDEVRVNSKSRDELQTVIAAVRAKEFPVAVQFVNFRD